MINKVKGLRGTPSQDLAAADSTAADLAAGSTGRNYQRRKLAGKLRRTRAESLAIERGENEGMSIREP